jgi:adenylate cyclase
MVGLFLGAARSREPGRVHEIEATLPGGRRAALRAGAGPVVDTAGTMLGIVFVAEDRSDEVAAEGEARAHAQKERQLRDALQRYVGETVAASIDARPSFIGVGGVVQEISVLHADVRGYTTIAEQLPPEAVHALLLRYHGAAVAALRAEAATVDRYVGDAILALWNASAPQERHPRLALRGALAMRDAANAVGTEMRYGIGVHTGDAVVGNLCSERYMHYTAIGDTVNVAARLQAGAEGGQVVCSAATLAGAGDGVRAAPLGEITLKGRKAPVEAYRIDAID